MPLRVLMVTSGLPHPPTSGAAIRIFQFARYLAKHHRLTLLSYGAADDDHSRQQLRANGIEVLFVPPPSRSRKRATQMLSLVSPRSHLGGMFHSSSMQRALDSMTSNRSYDVVIVEGSLLMRHRFSDRTPLVLDEHNIEFELLKRTARMEASVLRRFFNTVEAAKFKREEFGAWDRADLCVFTSKREVQSARLLKPNTKGLAIPNGVDLEYFRPKQVEIQPHSIVFTGTLGYRPNVDAVHYLVREVLPRIRRLRPDAVVTIVGGNVPRSVSGLAGPSVVLTGRVPDVRPFVESAAVMVAPLRMGSGTRLKVLEAFAMGKAIVSTTIGCEGIACNAGEHLAVADDPQTLAEAVVRYMNDQSAATAMGVRARALAERLYGWPMLAAQLEMALQNLVAKRRDASDHGSISIEAGAAAS